MEMVLGFLQVAVVTGSGLLTLYGASGRCMLFVKYMDTRRKVFLYHGIKVKERRLLMSPKKQKETFGNNCWI